MVHKPLQSAGGGKFNGCSLLRVLAVLRNGGPIVVGSRVVDAKSRLRGCQGGNVR